MNIIVTLLKGIPVPWIKWSIAGVIVAGVGAGVVSGAVSPADFAALLGSLAGL